MINIPSLPLKIVFFIHLVLTTWASQAIWSPVSYIYYNAFFLLAVLWGIHQKESDEPVFMAFVLDVASILIDIIIISVVMTDRMSGVSTDFGIPGLSNVLGGGDAPNQPRGPYEDIDRTGSQSVPHNNYEPFNPRIKGQYASETLPIPD
ncbi:hypothetical protein CHUAL_000907 [Chamberlinius hualienensis]